jgi:hypothetical protein
MTKERPNPKPEWRCLPWAFDIREVRPAAASAFASVRAGLHWRRPAFSVCAVKFLFMPKPKTRALFFP